MWKTVARFISEPVYQEVQFMKFYKATLENKNGNFVCSFGEKYLRDYSPEKKVCFLKWRKTNFGFSCQEIEFLDNNEEITSWVETAGKESREKAIQDKEVLKKELTDKAKIIVNLLEKETSNRWTFRVDSQPFSLYLESSEKPYLRFLISNFAKNQVILDNNLALNHLKNVYVDLAKVDILFVFKDIRARVKIIEAINLINSLV
jgi:hypothetical protein